MQAFTLLDPTSLSHEAEAEAPDDMAAAQELRPFTDINGYYHTGDLVRILSDGRLVFLRKLTQVGRLKNGEVVDLELLESCMESSDLVSTAFVVCSETKSRPVAIISVKAQVFYKLFFERTGRTPVVQNCEIQGQEDLGIANQICMFVLQENLYTDELPYYYIPAALKVYVERPFIDNRELFNHNLKKIHDGVQRVFRKEIDEMMGLIS